MNEPRLIYCPNCEENGKHTVLGSVTDEGYFKIRRYTTGIMTTTIKSNNYEVVCYCGFGTIIVNKSGQANYV